MAYFASLQQFIDSITARLIRPIRGVGGSEGVSNLDVLEALSDTGKWADDIRVQANGLMADYPTRFSSLQTTIYINPVSGSDINTGAVNSPIASLHRLAAIVSDKFNLVIVQIQGGVVEVTQDVMINVPFIAFAFNAGTGLYFRKKTFGSGPTAYEQPYKLSLFSLNAMFTPNSGVPTLQTENCNPVGGANLTSYMLAQGTINLVQRGAQAWMSYTKQNISIRGINLNIGNNTVMFSGTNSGSVIYNPLGGDSNYTRNSGTVTLGENAFEQVNFLDKVIFTLNGRIVICKQSMNDIEFTFPITFQGDGANAKIAYVEFLPGMGIYCDLELSVGSGFAVGWVMQKMVTKHFSFYSGAVGSASSIRQSKVVGYRNTGGASSYTAIIGAASPASAVENIKIPIQRPANSYTNHFWVSLKFTGNSISTAVSIVRNIINYLKIIDPVNDASPQYENVDSTPQTLMLKAGDTYTINRPWPFFYSILHKDAACTVGSTTLSTTLINAANTSFSLPLTGSGFCTIQITPWT
ncbi:hypothetical protein [Arundinibacter roseus]|uniref:Uncharacterized protein n=1 Tax=Arundinibacter roseus TaxID=2070510 RepID=A0A4R4JYN0_9BACT|nr:hypothetical protein [Arundinibacter roseus]TDB60077.1 hypothetical protein EZE20_21640 [Arundinibacter roseus]